MKLALISDIHGNLTALEAVMKSIQTEGVDQIVCLGDIVGYGPKPNECVELIQHHMIPTVLGNHDEASIGEGDISNFNHWATLAIHWVSSILSKNSVDFIKSLQFTYEFEDHFLTHASPDKPHTWRYLTSSSDVQDSFAAFRQKICFVGHTHIPCRKNERNGGRSIINVGSVGQPRDRNPKACWGLYVSEEERFEWLRVEYDISETAYQIRDAGLPVFLADRLAQGR